MNHKFIKPAAALMIAVCMILLAAIRTVPKQTMAEISESAYNTESDSSQRINGVKEDYEKAAADLLFWYEDSFYQEYFERAAFDYYSRTQVKVQPVCVDTLDYMGDIYDVTMQNLAYPDIYLTDGGNLEEAYLYGLAEENRHTDSYAEACPQSMAASVYKGLTYGYPLSFHSCVFVYQNGYFAEQPSSLQAIIDYSNENEPPENVEYLLEWNVNDPFYDFPFISNSVTFEKSEGQTYCVSYNTDLYEQDLAYFEQILESFSIDASQVNEDSIIEHFIQGKTLCAIIDSKDLWRLNGCDFSLIQIPDLNGTLAAKTCALTDMILVNPYSEKKEAAFDFALFVTTEETEKLHEVTGIYSVFMPDEPGMADTVVYQSYENAALAPNSRIAKDFWIDLKETIHKYF